MWGKGVSITLARMDQFIYNLGLDLWLYRHYMAPPEVFMSENGDLRCLSVAYGELLVVAADPV